MINRWIAALLAGMLGVNALVMLAAPYSWYLAVPGVTLTGPYNPHFVRDIGMAYLAVVTGLGWFAWRPRQGWAGVVCAAVFLVTHAGLHVVDASCSGKAVSDLVRDFPGVFLPAILTAWIAFAGRPAKAV